MSTEIVHIAGRYNKYRRNLSQSPWIDKDDVRIKNSVQELIEEGISKYFKYETLSFASCGREDVDVRMLGKGRPFVFKIHHAHDPASINDSKLREVENYVNNTYGNDIKVRDLQLVTKTSVSKHLNEGQEFKSKEYRALCCSSRKLTCDEIDRINNITELNLEQKTPIRVLHRRTLATRNRKIHKLRIDPVELGEFDCVNSEDLDQVFALTLVTEAGTYIKEFVHGDFGRTQPNLSSLIGGDCETDLIELDVMEVYMDWPPSLGIEPSGGQTCPVSEQLADKMDKSEEALAELYSKALKAMQEAENLPRGDDRQSLYLRSRQMFEKASELVESIALFSDNESIDDIATADLKYLLIPAYQAKIYISAECSSNRLTTFTQAELLIIKFFTRLINYGLGNEQMERAIKSDGLLSGGSTQQTSGDLQSAMRERNEKIEKFKRMKLLESRVEELERRIKSGEEVDDEINREYYLKLINKWTEDSLESLEREVRPAIFFERNRPADMDGPVVVRQQQARPSSSKGLGADGRPFTIVKNDLQKQVFGIGYPSRPTVTVDEFITKKIEDGDLAFEAHKEVYANSLQRYAEDPGLRRDQEEKSDEERDAKEDCDDGDELARKRRWDEFKDDNPRGSGNRHNMG